jgi:hypothetical protein
MPNVKVRTVTIVRVLIEVLKGQGYENKILTWSLSQVAPRYTITCDNNPLIDIEIIRSTELSEDVDMTIENIAGIKTPNLLGILDKLEECLDTLNFTFNI